MGMTEQDSSRFYQSLTVLAEFFGDELSTTRQKLYWRAVAPSLSLAEWDYACMEAVKRETFHRVPLPVVLIAYGRDYRQQRKWQEPARPALPEPAIQAEEVRKLMATVFKDKTMPEVQA